MTNQDYFRQYQKILLETANSKAGRFLLGIKDKAPIIKLTPNSFHQLMDFQKDRPIIKARFSTDINAISRILMPTFTKIELADGYKRIIDKQEAFLHYSSLEEKNYKYPQIYLATSNFIPGSGNGAVRRAGQATWAAARDTADGTLVVNNPTAFDAPIGTTTGGLFYLYRAFFPTDTSSIPDISAISVVVFNGYITTLNATPGDTYHIVQTSQASTSTLVLEDYNNYINVSGGSVVITATGAYTITFNSTGRNIISRTGFSLIGQINDHDLDNVAPTILKDPAQNFSAAASNKPSIDVTYTPFAGFAPFL